MALWTRRQQDETLQPKELGHSAPKYHRSLVYIATGVTAIGGLLFGFDTGVISGAVLFLKKDFALNALTEEIAVSAVLVGAIFGSAIAGKLSDALGRKIIILSVCVIFARGAGLCTEGSRNFNRTRIGATSCSSTNISMVRMA